MRTITRYLLGELVMVFTVSLLGITLVMILSLVGLEAVQKGLSPWPILQLIPFILPTALSFSIPATALFTACLVYGRISSANELVALKAAGVSPWIVARPIAGMAFVLSLVSVWLIDVAYSWGQKGVQQVVLHQAEKIVYDMLKSNRQFSTPKFSIVVSDVVGRELMHPTITIGVDDRSPPITVVAEIAELTSDTNDNSLVISLTNGEAQRGNESFTFHRRKFSQKIPLNFALTKQQDAESPSNLPMNRIPSEIERQRQKISLLEHQAAVEIAFNLTSGDFAHSNGIAWHNIYSELDFARQRLNRLHAEPWRRWASGFSCLCFVSVGVPVAIWRRSADVMMTFASVFLPIICSYFPFFMFGLQQAKNGALHPVFVWLGNVLCVAIGSLIWKWVNRY
jgi:lipopolysaccharide export system permease protein